MIESYFTHNNQKIQTSKDSSLLAMSSIKKWTEEVGINSIKKFEKKVSQS